MEKKISWGDIFIGREEELEILRDNVFVQTPGTHAFYALTGPNEIGKSHLFKKLRKDWKRDIKAQGIKDVFCVSMSVRGIIEYPIADPYWWFWICLINACKTCVPLSQLEEAGKAQPEAYKRIQEIYEFYTTESNYVKLEEGCQEDEDILALFQAYTQLGVQIILGIDEFCHLTEFYPEWNMEMTAVSSQESAEDRQVLREALAKKQKAASRIFSKLKLLSPSSIYTLNLTLLIMGRRTLRSFRYEAEKNSDFAAAFQNLVLQGFTNEELQLYRRMYKDDTIERNLGRELTDAELSDVIYYCGRHPGLLMKMHNLICTYRRTDLAKGIEYLYRRRGSNLRTIYDKLYELMMLQNVNRTESKSCIGTFMQLYFTPVYEKDQFEAQLESLCDYGFLLIQEEGTVFEMAGSRGESLANVTYKGVQYEPISPHFAYYLKSEVSKSGTTELYGLMARTELLVREWISMVYARKYPDTWKMVVHSLMNATHIKFYYSLEEKANKYAARERGIEYSPLDVLSYEDYAKIICADWDIYKNLFSFYTKEELNRVFVNVLKSCRNDVMHINQRMLDDRSRRELEEACKYILEESTKVRIQLDGIVPAPLIYADVQEPQVIKGKRYMYEPTIIEEGGTKRIEGYILFTTPVDASNHYSVGEVRYYKAKLTDQGEIALLENAMDEELLLCVMNWNAANKYYPVAQRIAKVPHPNQQSDFCKPGENIYELNELYWENEVLGTIGGYVYHKEGRYKFKARMSAAVVAKYLENDGIDFRAGFPLSVKVELKEWKNAMGAFAVGYTAQ